MDDSQKTKKELLDEVSCLRDAIEELEESKVRYQRLSETVLEAIAMHDNGVIVECNDAFAKIFEYEKSELVGKNIYDLIAEDSRDLVRQKVTSGVTEPYTAHGQTKCGRIFSALLTGVQVPYRGKEIRMATITDITAETAAREERDRALRKLKDIETAVNRSPAMLFLWEAHEGWTVDIVSENVLQLGYTPAQFIAGEVTLPGITHPEDVDRVEEEIVDYLSRGIDEWSQSYRFITKDGEVRWMRDWNKALRNEEGQVTHVQSVILDETEKKETELALAREKEWLRITLQSIGDAVIATDDCGKIILLNTVAEELTGWKQQDAQGRPLTEVFRIVNEETKEVCENPVKKVLESGIIVGLANHTALICKDGEEIPIEDSGAPIRNGKGEIIGVVLVFRDVREKRKAQKALRESEERYRTLFQSANDGIFLMKDYRVVDCNKKAEELYKRTRDEIIGMMPHELSPKSQSSGAESYRESIRLMDAALEGKPQYFEWTHIKADGGSFTAEIGLNKITLEDGDYILALIRDISERKAMENELRVSEERNRALIEHAPLGIFLSDKEGNLLVVNQALVNILGSPSQEATMGINILQFPLLIKSGVSENVRKCIEGDKSSINDFFYKSNWGKEIYCTLYLDPVHDAGGSVIGVQGIIEDITERKAAEDRLIQERKQLLSIFDGIGEAIYVSDPNTYEVLFVNRYLRDLIATDPVGKKCYKVFQGYDEPCPFCTNDIILENPGEDYQWEFYNPNLDRHYLLFDRIIKWPDDRNVRFEMAVDITDRKNAENELASEKERLAVTLRSIGDGVITTDTDGRVRLVNKIAEELTGWTQADAFGKPIEEVFHIVNEITGEKCENPVEKALNSGQVIELANHTKLISKDGTERIIADSGAPIRDKESKIVGVVLVFRDITRAKELEEELTRAQKLESVGLLAGGIAHDFNNILTAIIGNISIARDRTSIDSEQFDLLLDAEKASLQARNLTQQLLTFSKGGAPIRAVCSVKNIIEESCNLALRGSNTSCRFDFEDGLFNVEVDPGQISQVIHNLALNADQAMEEGGELNIKVRNAIIDEDSNLPLATGRYVSIEVSDTGKGVPKQLIDKVFDPYFTTKREGTGLGLAVCYSIVKNHDGIITVNSEVGIGTVFRIYLPASDKKMEMREDQSPTSGSLSGRILLMDDENIVRKAAKAMFSHLGYDVVVVGRGDELIETYEAEMMAGRAFDLVVMDLTIRGGLGGRETFERLKEIDENVVAIVSSGYSTDPVMADYKKFGFAGVLTKPYKMSELMSLLKELFNGK